MDIELCRTLNVNLKTLLYSQPPSGEKALAIVEALVKTGEVDIIVVDSVAALVPQAEIDGEMGATHVGLQARMMSQAMRKLTHIVAKSKTCVIFINQLREKVGGYGNPEVTTGGRALKFYSSVRLEVRKGDFIKKGNEPIGHICNFKLTKNKVAPPHKTGAYTVLYGKGVDFAQEIADIGPEFGIIQRNGGWITLLDPVTGQPELGADQKPIKWNGVQALRDEFETNKVLYQMLFSRMQDKLKEALSAIPMADDLQEDEEIPPEVAAVEALPLEVIIPDPPSTEEFIQG